ncbi:MAG TPA: hypothetical protein VN493_18430 [Thermoanaerobaculia bacterium]|nr:hypothetical protein [Thermoanaerobaculia bacterium]
MHRVWLALLATTVLSLPASAAGGEMARLLSPVSGAELTAGSFATIEWEGLALPPGAHEWEAFLSLDGGRTWPLRVTPHLDISIRRFSFRVPDLPARDARVMLRFGDEREEVGMVAPQRLSVTGGAFRDVWAPSRVLSRGEKAREGGEGVVVWVEGSLDGGDLREVVAMDPSASLHGVHAADLLVLPLGAPVSPTESLPSPSASPEPTPRPVFQAVEKREPRPAPVPVRLLTHRFNE